MHVDKHVTAGEKSLKALSDKSTYRDGLEVSSAKFDDAIEQVFACGRAHHHLIGEDEYFVVLQIAGDPLIVNLERHKYYAYLFMPSPRPQQAVWLYNKILDKAQFLWSLPNCDIMEAIYQATDIDKKWQKTKLWVKWFYDGCFWPGIRRMHNIKHLSEHEYLLVNKAALKKASGDDISPDTTDALDRAQVAAEKIVHLSALGTKKCGLNVGRQT